MVLSDNEYTTMSDTPLDYKADTAQSNGGDYAPYSTVTLDADAPAPISRKRAFDRAAKDAMDAAARSKPVSVKRIWRRFLLLIPLVLALAIGSYAYIQLKANGNLEEGWRSIYVSLCIFLAGAAVLFASALMRLHRRSWYGYEMIACAGSLLFCLAQFAFFSVMLMRGGDPSLWQFLVTVSNSAEYFVLLSFFPMGFIALLLFASNISLIRHEGFRPVNLLGIAFGIAWAAANVLLILVGSTWSGVGVASRAMQTVNLFITVGIALGECLLVATMLCAWLASRHVPQHGVDYLVVLGCGIRSDGKPFPLLQRRIDRAIAFDAERVSMGDEPSVFVCSGGQGPDEPISEALSMSDYLQENGVTRERIVLEDRSTTTNENMAFSREVIEKHAHRDAGELRVGFSTTNYHVLRGYVCAHKAGMNAEGLGSKTRYYFWPNAFIREFAGLLVWQWKPIVQTYAIIVLIYLYLSSVIALV